MLSVLNKTENTSEKSSFLFSQRIPFQILNGLFLAMVQFTVLPWFNFGIYTLDLLTPWLILFFVNARPGHSIYLLALVALLQETACSAPISSYFVAYLFILSLVEVFREKVSWDNDLTWAVLFGLSQLIVSLVQMTSHSQLFFADKETLDTFLIVIINGLFSLVVGMIYVQVIKKQSAVIH